MGQGFLEAAYRIRLERVGDLPPQIREASGMVVYHDQYFWVNDSGNEAVIWEIDQDLKLVDSYALPMGNRDWGSLAIRRDTLLVGDIRNNANRRRSLSLFYYNLKTRSLIREQQLSYARQEAFPPKKRKRNYDAEAPCIRWITAWVFGARTGAISVVMSTR